MAAFVESFRGRVPSSSQVLPAPEPLGTSWVEEAAARSKSVRRSEALGGREIQARGVITIDTTGSDFGDIGIVAVIPIGMCQVSSVNMIHATETVLPDGSTGSGVALKGDEFGYFLFGGSDIIVLFQAGMNPQINTGGQYRRYGTTIATCAEKVG